MTGETWEISVVIRTRDREKFFDRLLENLALQTLRPSEIIVVNNYSSEDERRRFESEALKFSLRLFERNKISFRIVGLPDEAFSHAYSTNLGVYTARNELVCITNAHSLPISLRWLQEGVKHFSDEAVAGVSGFFLPHRDGLAFGKIDEIIYLASQRIILRQDWCSTINCIIRKSLWRIYPFDEKLPEIIPQTGKYGLEDYDWSKEMLSRGYRIIVDKNFSVYHSHGKGLDEMIRNVRGYFIYRHLQGEINKLRRPRESFSRLFA